MCQRKEKRGSLLKTSMLTVRFYFFLVSLFFWMFAFYVYLIFPCLVFYLFL